MRIVIVKYNAGNTGSVVNALSRIGVEAAVSDNAETIRSADKVILPGVGEASSAMNHLSANGLADVITKLRQPVLGICLGMQLLSATSEENDADCLSVIPYRVRRFAGRNVKVPHVGWNTIHYLSSSLFSGVEESEHFYFVHGYFVETGERTTARCEHGEMFSAALCHDNFHAVQFHPEKSGIPGQRVLENFVSL